MFRANFCPPSGAQDWDFLQHMAQIYTIPYAVKNLSLALLKMGKNLPETC